MSFVNFGEIKRRREKLKLTHRAAAEQAGWSSGQIWANMEQGKTKDLRISTLIRITAVLKCKVDQLLVK